MTSAVHQKSNGCTGPIVLAELTKSRSDHDGFSAGCRQCGAIFGRVPVSHPRPASIALGITLAGGSVEQYANACSLSDLQAPSKRTLNRWSTNVAVAVDEVFDREIGHHQEKIKDTLGRQTMTVPLNDHYFAKNRVEFSEIIQKGVVGGTLGVKVTCRVCS